MRKKRVMIIGAEKSGKTTLANRLNGIEEQVRRKPNMVYGNYTIDVPGAYLECPWMHCHLIGTAGDALCVLMLIDQSKIREIYPPYFAKAFRVPVLGVITKSDLDKENEELCLRQIKRIGITLCYKTSLIEDTEYHKLKEAIFQYEKGGRV